MSEATPRHRFLALGSGGLAGIIAHRGDSFHAPENTLEGARLAFEAGADAWELDVRLTRDGVPVLLHDASLRRTTDVASRFPGDPRGAAGYRLADFDLDEVRRLDAGGWFLDPAGGHRSARSFGTLDRLGRPGRDRYGSGLVRVPTLAEALELTRDLDWLVNVELKSDFGGDNSLSTAVLAAIASAGVADRVLVSSFDHEDLADLVGRADGVAAGVLTSAPLFGPARYVRRLGAQAYHPSAEALGEGPGPSASSSSRRRGLVLERLRSAGVPVFVYTVNDAAKDGLADRLIGAGVSGVFTDDPAGLVGLWRRSR